MGSANNGMQLTRDLALIKTLAADAGIGLQEVGAGCLVKRLEALAVVGKGDRVHDAVQRAVSRGGELAGLFQHLDELLLDVLGGHRVGQAAQVLRVDPAALLGRPRLDDIIQATGWTEDPDQGGIAGGVTVT